MQIPWRFSFSFVFLLFGVGILWVSLISASRVLGSEEAASDMRFYVSDEILPDHVGYPLLIIADRARLEASSQRDAVYIKVEYAERRLEYAKKMIEKNKKSLALSTLTKSQKYLNQAAQDVLDHNMPEQDKQYVSRIMKKNLAQVRQLADSFETQDKSLLDQLCCEGQQIQDRINHSLEKQN
ncbi:MAG: DUF5667 domain-containing protein [Patescibacteria group bacterium]